MAVPGNRRWVSRWQTTGCVGKVIKELPLNTLYFDYLAMNLNNMVNSEPRSDLAWKLNYPHGDELIGQLGNYSSGSPGALFLYNHSFRCSWLSRPYLKRPKNLCAALIPASASVSGLLILMKFPWPSPSAASTAHPSVILQGDSLGFVTGVSFIQLQRSCMDISCSFNSAASVSGIPLFTFSQSRKTALHNQESRLLNSAGSNVHPHRTLIANWSPCGHIAPATIIRRGFVAPPITNMQQMHSIKRHWEDYLNGNRSRQETPSADSGSCLLACKSRSIACTTTHSDFLERNVNPAGRMARTYGSWATVNEPTCGVACNTGGGDPLTSLQGCINLAGRAPMHRSSDKVLDEPWGDKDHGDDWAEGLRENMPANSNPELMAAGVVWSGRAEEEVTRYDRATRNRWWASTANPSRLAAIFLYSRRFHMPLVTWAQDLWNGGQDGAKNVLVLSDTVRRRWRFGAALAMCIRMCEGVGHDTRSLVKMDRLAVGYGRSDSDSNDEDENGTSGREYASAFSAQSELWL
ncbi:hypothetical protein BU15DRAFT_61912 [Melanogaster broomeanus]|nr:hypothetical protein BU15DRAFT_61912 [Melanogaster broomeanus]